MARDYCAAADIKAYIPDWQGSTTYDTLLGYLATNASRAIDKAVGRWPGFFLVADSDADETRWFDGPIDREEDWDDDVLRIDEIPNAPTTIHIAEGGDTGDLSAVSATDYWVYPLNYSSDGRPGKELRLNPNGAYSGWPRYRKAVRLVGNFGFALTVPATIKQAAVMQSVRWFKRLQSGMQTTGAIPELAQLVYTQLDPDIAELLKPYMLELTE